MNAKYDNENVVIVNIKKGWMGSVNVDCECGKYCCYTNYFNVDREIYNETLCLYEHEIIDLLSQIKPHAKGERLQKIFAYIRAIGDDLIE